MDKGGSGVTTLTKYCSGCYKDATKHEKVCSGCGGKDFKDHKPVELGREIDTSVSPQGPATWGVAGVWVP